MFIGHHAAAFAAKRVAPRASPGTLMAAAMARPALADAHAGAGLVGARGGDLRRRGALIYAANFVSPPPPSRQAVAWTALAAWLFVVWAWWLDRHRVAAT